MLSHEEQMVRLTAACPEAVNVSVVAGDPCLDRLTASKPLRAVYRDAFGARDKRLVVVTSTWGSDSLLGQGLEWVDQCAGLPIDSYRTVVVLHPNVRAWHSPWQVDRWLDSVQRAGLVVLPSDEGWRAALVAADVVIGDHGSVTFYAAAIGAPVLAASAPVDAVAPESPVGRFLAVVPKLVTGLDLAEQVDAVIDAHDPGRFAELTALATSAPGRSAELLQREVYRLLGLDVPVVAQARAVPVPVGVDRPLRDYVVDSAIDDDGVVTLVRYSLATLEQRGMGGHIVVSTDEPIGRHLELADVVSVSKPGLMEAMLDALPGASLATAPDEDGKAWLVSTRDGRRFRFTGRDAEVGSSVVFAWLAAGLDALPAQVSVRLGTRISRLGVD